MINAEKLNYETIVDALLNGSFYVSGGPLIESLVIKDNKVKIKCSGVKKISYSTFGRRAKCISADEGTYLTKAEFEIKKTDKYFRITLKDEFGNYANTQSYEV